MADTAGVRHRTASTWVERFSGRITPGGTVLDLACGSGRHGRLFSDRGHPVVFLDQNVDSLADLEAKPGVEIICADLENDSPWPLADRRFAAVVVTNYLHRPLFPDILAAVAPGGWLLYETFAAGNEKYGRPSNPDFLLEPGELLARVDNELEIADFWEGVVERPKPAVIQQLAAFRPVLDGCT